MRAEAAAQAELLAAFRGRRELRQQMQEEALRDKIRQQHLLGGGWAQEDAAEADERCRSRVDGRAQDARAWLRAVLQHERQWVALEATSSSSCGLAGGEAKGTGSMGATLGLADVPWPPLGSTEYLAGLSALEQQVAEQQQWERQPATKQQEKQRSAWQRAQRRAYARACLRWHPDKFEARWGRQLAAADREAVLARVQEVSQGINAAWEQLQRGTAC